MPASNNRFTALHSEDIPSPAGPSSQNPMDNIAAIASAAAAKTPSRPPLPGSTSTPGTETPRRKRHRAGKKKRSRRKSFAIPDESHDDAPADRSQLRSGPFYTLHDRNLSNTSIDSEALLDHRDHQQMRLRRPSTMPPTSSYPSLLPTYNTPRYNTGSFREQDETDNDHVHTPYHDESSPLLATSGLLRGRGSETQLVYGSHDARSGRLRSRGSSRSSRTKPPGGGIRIGGDGAASYDVNYPPSVPASPRMGPSDRMDMSLGDVMIRDELVHHDESSPRNSLETDSHMERAMLLDPVDHRRIPDADVCFPTMSELAEEDAPRRDSHHQFRSRRRRGAQWPDLSVLDAWSRFEKRSEDQRAKRITEPQLINGRLRPVRKGWYRTEEDAPYRFTYFNEEFQSTIHSQTISELLQPGGSFRELFIPDPPILSDDETEDDDEDSGPFGRANFPAAHPVPSSESKNVSRQPSLATTHVAVDSLRHETISPPPNSQHSTRATSSPVPRATSTPSPATVTAAESHAPSEAGTVPAGVKSPTKESIKQTQSSGGTGLPTKPIRYGDRPVWWLDVLSPTESEMKIISKAFGIHPLTAEDIMMQEAREKVELFRNYYFVNYRTFDQDVASEDYLEPVNMYVVVFREGVLSFHFSMTPHAANVRRRIRQLKDYLILSPDWISYAIIDDITDGFGPLIQNIEDEVDEIDMAVLRLHSSSSSTPPSSPTTDSYRNKTQSLNNGTSTEGRNGGWLGGMFGSASGDKACSVAGDSNSSDAGTAVDTGADMLRRVGDCRKRVMSLYRLLGNKADVIKGFAKRCNERWDVAPRSEIGLYLGDIQDHIVTMTGNLSHYQKILADSHANYLAQINIKMNERAEHTNDVLGKLTVLGTIVLPMNIITGLWGMNVWVPGQEYEGDLVWFWCITAGLTAFGIVCYLIARQVYRIV